MKTRKEVIEALQSIRNGLGDEIPKAMSRASAVTALLSALSQKRGYLQKEIARVLDESDANQKERSS